MDYILRLATLDDQSQLQSLIARSARALGAADYTAEQIEGALRGAFGVDTQLILDGTYFVVEAGNGLAGCGGWSWRRTLFGGNNAIERDAGPLDPATDAAKIRAFFVDPDHARRGIGRMILQRCEAEAAARGFTTLELMGTLPGVRLYTACGYAPLDKIDYEISPGLTIPFVPMRKTIR
jgi:GNAT superfamily N-acetyltransferase